MLKKRGLIGYVLIVTMISCYRSPVVKIIKEDYITYQPLLQGEGVKMDSLKSPVSLGLVDTFLVLINKYDKSRFQIYDAYNSELVFEYKDTLDIKNPFYFNRFYRNNGDLMFEIVDFSNNILYTFVETKSDSQVAMFVINSTDFIPMKLVNRFYRYFSLDLNRTIYFGAYLGREKSAGRYFYHKSKTPSEIEWISFENSPHNSTNILISDLPYINYSYLSFNEDKKILGAGFKFFKSLEFMNIKGEVFKKSQFVGSGNFEYKANILTVEEMPIFYNASFATKEYLYLLCVNSTQKRYNDNKGNIELHVFSWDGELKFAAKLDRMKVGEFVVNESTNELFLLSYIESDKNNPIIKYDISKIFTNN
ncbi:hypothetical protein [Sphingobacterium sp. MYb382]|uniref:hypothetical protein n=1 Tax=Sphingobacterium sp. MYb382 TaxID=2745278 RepID=UPI0030A85B4B